MYSTNSDSFGKLILRWTIALLMIFHGYAKFTHGLGFIETMLSNNNLPTFLAYGVYVGEILAPILLIIGYKTRFAALIIVLNMFMAIYLVHSADLIALTKNGALVLELQYFYILASFAIIFFGPGKFSIDRN